MTTNTPFQGITPLHIAAYMDIEREINRYLGEGKNPEANGKWPGMPGGITPRCIMKSHMAYTKMQQLENEPNRLRKVWGKQLMIFDRNVTSKSSTDFLELISRDTKAAKGLMQAVTKWTARWQKKEALPV